MKLMITKDELKLESNCAKLVATKLLEYFEYPKTDEIEKLLLGFGKGFDEGSVCGAISGALIAMNNILNRHGLSEDEINDVIHDMKSKFKAKYHSVNCEVILENYVGISEISPKTEEKHLSSCSALLNDTTIDVNELINYAISFANPIMQRFNRI